VKRGELRVEYCPTNEMHGDFFTKPLQGSKFRKFRQFILNSPPDADLCARSVSQECVGKRTYAEVVRDCPARVTYDAQPIYPNKLKSIHRNATSPVDRKANNRTTSLTVVCKS
jgi:hypothetical protein